MYNVSKKLLIISLIFTSLFISCKKRNTSSSELLSESLITISTKNESVKPGSNVMITVTVQSKYTDLYWTSQSVFLYSDNYDSMSFVKWAIPDMSDGAEDVMGEVISYGDTSSYYLCGIIFDKKHASTKSIVYNVTFKLNENVNPEELNQINFYLKTGLGNINSYKDKDGNELDERRKEIAISHGVENKLTIPVISK